MAKTNKTIWRSDEKAAQDIATGAGAMSVTFDPEGSCRLYQINIHLSAEATTAENLTISLDSANGTEYDVKVLTKAMSGVQDVIITTYDIGEFYMFGADKLVATWANTDSRTWGLEIIYRRFSP